jgi:hypothetical protein
MLKLEGETIMLKMQGNLIELHKILPNDEIKTTGQRIKHPRIDNKS